MEKYNLKDMTKGWFVGNFNPSVLKTNDFESAIKCYKKGDFEKRHHHKIATEITVVIAGKIKMNETQYEKNDIVIVKANESVEFQCIEDAITVVIKYPGANNDKYKEEI